MTEYTLGRPSPPGDTIADLLEERGWTHLDLAERLHISEDSVRRLLSGEDAITFSTAEKLYNAFGAPTQFWLARERRYREAIE